MRRWYSIHRNCKEDRIHSFQCRYGPVGPVAYHACSWTHHFVNDYDRPVTFKCNQNGFLTGVKSEYSHRHKDRRYNLHLKVNSESVFINSITSVVQFTGGPCKRKDRLWWPSWPFHCGLIWQLLLTPLSPFCQLI